jgi:hypothetical protein
MGKKYDMSDTLIFPCDFTCLWKFYEWLLKMHMVILSTCHLLCMGLFLRGKIINYKCLKRKCSWKYLDSKKYEVKQWHYSSLFWHHVDLRVDANTLKKHNVSIFRAAALNRRSWWWWWWSSSSSSLLSKPQVSQVWSKLAV